MPSSLDLLVSGPVVYLVTALLSVVASLLTLIASTLLLRRYRRTVARLMSATARGTADRAPDPATPLPAPNASSTPGAARHREPNLAERCFRASVDGPWRHARRYAAGGLLFATIVGWAAFQAFSQTQINPLRAATHPLQLLFLIWTFAWPVVLTANLVATTGWRKRCLVVMTYFAVLAMLGALLVLTPTEPAVQQGEVSVASWSGETPIRLLGKWIVFNLGPTLLVGMFRIRRVRAVAPLVLSFMTVVAAGLLAMVAAVWIYREPLGTVVTAVSGFLGLSFALTFVGCLLLLMVIACTSAALLGWCLLVWMRHAYLRKVISDQSLAIDAMWLVFATFYAAILIFVGPGWVLAVPVALAVFRMTVRTGNRSAASRAGVAEAGPALLVLRVFSLGQRSERLFELVSKYWRHIGNVQLIVGIDLATSTIAPHQFLAFVAGKLQGLFIDSSAAIERSAGQLDTRRDQDGRFRINDFYCHADTWQRVLVRLVSGSDAVLMDLRSFSPGNDGCVFEIKALLNAVPLERLLFVIDATTDKVFLNRTLAQACRELSSASPNVGLQSEAVQPFELESLRQNAIEELLRLLCTAAAGGLERRPRYAS